MSYAALAERVSNWADRVATVRASLIVKGESQQTTYDADGHAWHILDLELDGVTDGIVWLDGPVATAHAGFAYLYDVPAISLAQERYLVHDPRLQYLLPPQPVEAKNLRYGRSSFAAAQGSGIDVIIPESVSRWNGKLFIVQHGSGTYTRLQPLVVRTRADGFPRGTGASHFIEWMIDRGFAVANLRRDAVRPGGGISEATVDRNNHNTVRTSHLANLAQILALVRYAQDETATRLGRRPSRTYWYGHSGGGIAGRLINQVPLANLGTGGRPVVDGIIADDTGNGLYMPFAFDEAGRDYLYTTVEERTRVVPQIDVSRHLYFPNSFRVAKRLSAKIMLSKELHDRHRYYELLGTSHFEAAMALHFGPREAIDLGGFFAALVDVLDDWVEKGREPPTSRAELDGFDPPIALPEVAAPLGDYEAPDDGAFTRFTAFGSQNAVSNAWLRRGLLKPGEVITARLYADRLVAAAEQLVRDRLLAPECVIWYRRNGVHHAGLQGMEEA